MANDLWIGVANRTGIDALQATTRDIPNYDTLMRQRLSLLEQHGLKLSDIQDVIGTLKPLDGALEFLEWLRPRFQVIILSDTFYEFAAPLMRQLSWPTLFCNYLEIDEKDRVVGYQLRQPDQKRQAVEALQSLGFRTIAAGDSYNDISMLGKANAGIFFRPPKSIVQEFPQYPVTWDHEELRTAFTRASVRDVSM